ncbi:MAG: glycosyltransferase [Mycobacterium sp.]|nr:glycosyltransferase [Mycobacterium sp.]
MSTLSLCMIVRNEEGTLGRCLESVAGVFDEIVIADTGSTDTTREIAERFGAKVVEFPWVDDFAAARNFSFAQGSSEYLMWLDADDVLAPEQRAKLLSLKDSLDPGVDAVSMLYHTAFDDAGNVIASNRRLRIVRRTKGFTWVGTVHEDLVINESFTFFDSDIVITHRKPESESGPSDRNLRILEKLITDGRDVRPVDVLNYARELEMHKQFAAATPYYEQFLASGEGDLDVRTFALHKLASCYYMSGQPDKEFECTLRSFDIDVPRPEFSCRMAERFLSRNQFSQAAFWYELALQVQGTPSAWSIDSLAFRTWLPHKQLGLCYYQLGDYQRSLHHNREAQKYLPDDPDIRTNIGVLEGLISE